jgi:hypothetical protein
MSDHRFFSPVATFLADAGALAGVWTFSSFFFGGVAGCWAGLLGEEVGPWAQAGGIVGFAVGAPVTLAAGVWLL